MCTDVLTGICFSSNPAYPKRSIVATGIATVLLIALLLTPTLDASASQDDSRPLLTAVYYTWYTTGNGPHGVWNQWGSKGESLLAPKGTDADTFLLPPALRDISSCAYPLIGPYDSDDPQVVRWHIYLAKAAGIDAFMVDWWGPAGWQNPTGFTHDVFTEVVLPIAEEEGFKVCIFDETAQFLDNFEQVKKWAATYLAKFKDSPAYFRINGEPVYAIYQIPFAPRLTPEQATELHDYVEKRVGPVYWLVDKIANGPNPITKHDGFVIPDEWLHLDWIDAFMAYGTFSVRRIHTYEALKPLYEGFVKQAHQAGKHISLPVHPGHNNSKLQKEPYVIPWEDGKTFLGYLRAAREAGPDMVHVTSFNEWPETTIIEPAVTWPDPYLYFRLLAESQHKTFKLPAELPRTLHLKRPPKTRD